MNNFKNLDQNCGVAIVYNSESKTALTDRVRSNCTSMVSDDGLFMNRALITWIATVTYVRIISNVAMIT